MNSITPQTLRDAAVELSAAMQGHEDVDVHTVTVILNGHHGGADVRIEGTVGDNLDEFFREAIVR